MKLKASFVGIRKEIMDENTSLAYVVVAKDALTSIPDLGESKLICSLDKSVYSISNKLLFFAFCICFRIEKFTTN